MRSNWSRCWLFWPDPVSQPAKFNISIMKERLLCLTKIALASMLFADGKQEPSLEQYMTANEAVKAVDGTNPIKM